MLCYIYIFYIFSPQQNISLASIFFASYKSQRFSRWFEWKEKEIFR